jgi:predicted  nucleic acid-binding Zn-ribbon protein
MTAENQIRSIEDRLLTIETRLEGFDTRFNAIDQRLDRLDARIDSNLKWLMGVIIATWITTIGAVIGTAVAL